MKSNADTLFPGTVVKLHSSPHCHNKGLTTSNFEDEEDTLSSPMPPSGPGVTGEARVRSNTTQKKRKIEVSDVEKLCEVLYKSIEQHYATPQLLDDEDKLFLL
ncbi:hypothetical protein PR048_024803 [Dryococelus australis]|uniref:Uncharacterized protein n=1 Tax=Dryococelus australis TaxID=614101 RepID=A0ABQ9GPK9_9NEOP|nr:hypothetical protein PR048_024803 [Dryococelus australis]